MNNILRLTTRLLAPLILLAAFAHGVADARGTRQCLREAQRDFNRCRRRAQGRRGALARCRRADHQRRSACSG